MFGMFSGNNKYPPFPLIEIKFTYYSISSSKACTSIIFSVSNGLYNYHIHLVSDHFYYLIKKSC